MRFETPQKADELVEAVDPEIIDRSIFKVDRKHLRVSGDGVFYTLQGEGMSMGKLASFLRLHHCNLDCSWCDAWYTWNENSKEFWTESMLWTAQETRRKIEESWQCTNPAVQKNLVVTGGEPLMQQLQIVDLINDMPDWNVEIETNGTIMPCTELLERCHFNCSPKLKNSGVAKRRRIRGGVLRKINEASSCFKFVTQTPQDVDEIEKDFVEPFELDQKKIIVMPEGVSAEEVSQTAQRIVEEVKTKGYRLLGRLQCEIWGVRRAT